MSKHVKLINRLKAKPTDFEYSEAKNILESFGYMESNKGKTSGSRVAFINQAKAICFLHKPHKGNHLKEYQVEELMDFLEKNGHI